MARDAEVWGNYCREHDLNFFARREKESSDEVLRMSSQGDEKRS
jgi:hypothetical protein